MTRAFRFVPPEPRPGLVVRPRLLRSLAERWQHRVTALTGGPGLGKTTALTQAIAENRLAPRGLDHWVGLESRDVDVDSLARVVAAAIEHQPGAGGDLHERARQHAAVDPATVADAVWNRAPNEACLIFDDAHLLTLGSGGAEWLEVLVGALPANGHVVLASRGEPPVRLGGFTTRGEVLMLDEDTLRFDDDELASFARHRGVDPTWLDETGGWPAMAELVATVDRRLTGAYLWEEVLEPLGTVGRHVLAVLCDLGGADDPLMSAAVGVPVELARVLRGVPLVARARDGWHVPHGLWREASGLRLDAAERAAVRRRAVDHLVGRGRFDDAFGLLEEAELWDLAPQVLRSACLQVDHLSATQLARWLSRTPDRVHDTVAGRLAAGVHAWFARPAEARAPLQDAAQHARDEGDVDAEVTAVARLAVDAWWRQDTQAMVEQALRVNELEATGNARARGLATLGRAVAADLGGDDDQVLALLGSIEPDQVDAAAWQAACIWLRGAVLVDQGDVDGVRSLAASCRRSTDPVLRYIVEVLELIVAWFGGDVDGALARAPAAIRQARQHGVNAYLHVGLTLAATAYAHVGDVEAARELLEDVRATAPPTPSGAPLPGVLLTEASVMVVEGVEEAKVAEVVRRAVSCYGLDFGMDRRLWRWLLPLSYVLVPETRPHWDAQPLRGRQRLARHLASAVVGLREGRAEPRLHDLEVPPPGVVRALLGFQFTAELAVGLTEVGRTEGQALLTAAGPRARAVARELANRRTGSGIPVPQRRARAARALLAAVPAPPPCRTYLSVLGPLSLRRDGPDGEEVVDPDLRRKRVQALLAYLVGHRRTTRAQLAGVLWPDLDERSAGNNLGVTVNHLLRILEPWREPGEPSYILRLDGPSVHLVVDEFLQLDVDEFDEHVRAAAQAEADGTPSVALEHHLAAVACYRDTLHLDVDDVDWLDLDREHYRARFVVAAVRAGQLLLARGDVEEAQVVAHRALSTDPWSEDAYAVLIGAALARRDHSGARRLLQRCEQALAELGVEPHAAIDQLRRRVELA